MSSAQLQLLLELPSQTPLEPDNRSQEKSSNTNASASKEKIVVTELRTQKHSLDVIRLAREFVLDVDLNEQIDEDVIILSCARILKDYTRDHINVFVAYQGDQPIGFLVGVATPAFHRRGIVAEQRLCYVTPSARGGYAVVKLMKSFDSWARINGATQIYTGTANNRYAERTSQLLEKLGYRRVGSTHVKEI